MRKQGEGGSTPLSLQVGLEGTTIVVLFNKKITQIDLTPEQAISLGTSVIAAAKVVQAKGTIQ